MSKKIIILLVIFFIENLIFSITPYTTWFQNFKSKLNAARDLSEDEITAIEDELEIMPQGNENDYDQWMSFFRQKLNCGPDMDENEETILKYLLKAKPANNALYYLTFLECFDFVIKNAGAVFDETDEKTINLTLEALTETSYPPMSDKFNIEWQKKYNFYINKFRDLDDNEKIIIDSLKKAMPKSKQVTVNTDPALQKVQMLFSEDTYSISNALKANDYYLGSRMVEIIETFYNQLKTDAVNTGDEKLKGLKQRLENLN
ncbi:MAG: hypothetical protein ACD_79C00353G0001 [uncultured bacterium]|nr:MAG: hypothetical protein ACD_79C00353G0001 [uncultured bacterium]